MLKLGEKEVDFDNPLRGWTQNDLENPLLALLRVMRRPEYFYFTCKHLLNVRLLPFQQVILQELWYRPFPMLVASRGGGKSFLLGLYSVLRGLLIQGRKIVITGSGFRQAKTVYNYAENVYNNAPVLRSMVAENHRSGPHHQTDRFFLQLGDSTVTALPLGDGCLSPYTLITYNDRFATISDHGRRVWGGGHFRETDEHYINGRKPTKTITTRRGYSFQGTYNHRMKIVRNGVVDFVRADEMVVGDRILVDRSVRWHESDLGLSVDDGYALGLLVGDGSWCMKYRLGFASQDSELASTVARLVDRCPCSDAHLNWHGPRDRHHYSVNSRSFVTWLHDHFGLVGEHAIDKEFPRSVMSSRREVVSAFISGLYDTDGHVQASTAKGGIGVTVGFTNTSEQLVDQLHYILLHYGIVATKTNRQRPNKNWNRVYELLITGPDVRRFHEHIGFRLARKRDILSATLSSKPRDYGHGDHIPDIQADMVAVARRHRIRQGGGTSDSAAVSASKLQQRRGITHDLARRFLEVYGHLENVEPSISRIRKLANPDVFYDEIVSIEDGECETFDIHVPDDHEYCANGFFSHNTKIRGERAHDILCDEFACLDESTLVETGKGLVRIGDYVNDNMTTPVLTGTGIDVETPQERVRTPLTDAYRVKTVGGYEFICSDKHEVKTTNGWKLGRQLQTGDMLVVANTGYFPKDAVVKGNLWVNELTAWLMGILTAEGSINSEHYMSVHMTDKDCIDRIVLAWRNFKVFGQLNPRVYERQAYVDKRGWQCKHSYSVHVCSRRLRDEFAALGLDRATAVDKKVPWSILASPRHVVISYLSGLFEGDGSAFLWTDRDITNKFGIAYYSVSEQLCREVQVLLKKLGIFCTRQSRPSKISERPQWMLRVNGEYALKLQELLDVPKWREMHKVAYRPDTDHYRGVTWDKSRRKWQARTTVYGKLKYLGRFETQDEAIGAIIEGERELDDYLKVRTVEKLPEQRQLYDFHMPISHSFVGNGFLQHNSVPRETFETVVAGFGVVELDPVEKVERAAEIRVLKKYGLWTPEMEEENRRSRLGNQSIISGTAYYQFNHFAEYWKRWKGIIHSKGDPEKLRLILGDYPDPGFDWRDYSIIRIPYTLLPEGYMDERHVARSKATVHSGIFLNEFGAVFSSDTNGFFKRSLVESCVCNEPIPVGGELVQFPAVIRGDPNLRYVYGVDPASEHDKFSIVVLELRDTHQRIVYCWTTDKAEHQRRLQAGLEMERDFYGFCARKIRELMKVFPCMHIAIDSQGGGIAVREALHDPDKLKPGEAPIWEVRFDNPLSPDKQEKPTDNYAGLHILEMCHFARADYTSEANHGLRKDFEDKVCLFPMTNGEMIAKLAVSWEHDNEAGRTFDTLDMCFQEIEELKEELSTIVHTQTPGTNRDHWDTPEVKLAGSRKGRLRKDRYSALVMANYAARRLQRQPETPEPQAFGGFVGQIKHGRGAPDYIQGPSWFVRPQDKAHRGLGMVIRRGVR